MILLTTSCTILVFSIIFMAVIFSRIPFVGTEKTGCWTVSDFEVVKTGYGEMTNSKRGESIDKRAEFAYPNIPYA